MCGLLRSAILFKVKPAKINKAVKVLKHNDLHFQCYKEVLHIFLKTRIDSELEGKDTDESKNVDFRVFDHGIVTWEQNKLGLSAYDKGHFLVDDIHTKSLDS